MLNRIFGSGDDEPKNARDILAQEGYDDCMSCRLTGASAFIGLGVYSLYSGLGQLNQKKMQIENGPTKYKMASRRLGLYGISGTLVMMGVWRAMH